MLTSKYVLSVVIICSTLALYGQEFPYSLQIHAAPYSSLTEADTIDTNGPWDDQVLSLPIGFDFSLFGEPIDTLYFNGLPGAHIMGSETVSPVLVPYGSNLTDRGYNTNQSESPILYKIDRVAPNRVFKIEWQNAGFFHEQSIGINESFVNFQVWLYETYGIIEFRYGSSNIVMENMVHNYGAGPHIGLIDQYNEPLNIPNHTWYLTGDCIEPDIIRYDGGVIPDSALVHTPLSLLAYLFSPTNVSAISEEELIMGVQIYPNPVSDHLQLKLDLEEVPDQLEVRLFNALGQQVYYQSLDQQAQGQIAIEMAALPKGIYTVQLSDGKAQLSKTVVKS